MKKILTLTILFMMATSSAQAVQTTYSNGQPTGFGGQSYSSYGNQTKVYNQYGSLQGYVKPTGGGQYVTYDKYHQRSGRYQVQSDGRLKVYDRAGH